MTTPSKDDVLRIAGKCNTQAAVAMYLAGAEESRAALAAADERIREMEDEIKERSALSARRESAFTKAVHAQITERAISDKLEKALEIAIIGACAVGVPHNGERNVLREAVESARAAIAEVAAMRKGEQG